MNFFRREIRINNKSNPKDVKLTAIIPVYNVEKYLNECLSSVIVQTEPFDEIILINDGSTDYSPKICREYADRYSNILYINQDNRGLGAARNRGLEKATGDYIIFIDSDDYIKKETCAVLKKALKPEEIEILYYNAAVQYDVSSSEKEDAFLHSHELDTCYMTGMEYLEKAFPGSYTASACVAAYNRAFLKKHHIKFPEGIYFEDSFFSLQVMTAAEIVAGISNLLYIRRCRNNSIMTSHMTEKKCRDLVTNQCLMWEYLVASPIWSEKKKILRRFLSFGILQTLMTLSKETGSEEMWPLQDKLIQHFFKDWVELFREEKSGWEENAAFLFLLKVMASGIKRKENYISKYYASESQLSTEINQIQRNIWIQVRKLLDLPFGEEGKKIGIYGMGKHTQVLLALYRKKVGRIRAELFFIVSEENEKRKDSDCQVVTYREIPDDTDCIVISSYTYQQEMHRNLLGEGIKEDKIRLLYTGTSICDLAMLVQIINDSV